MNAKFGRPKANITKISPCRVTSLPGGGVLKF